MSEEAGRRAFLKWMETQPRYHHEASDRWGHFYEDALHDGLVERLPDEVYMLGRHRDIRTPIRLATRPTGD